MISALETWYLNQCNGDWEHQYGVEIGTLDNPGWRIRIDLMETSKQDVALEKTEIARSDADWITYWVAANQFHAACGPENLSEAIALFVQWFDSH